MKPGDRVLLDRCPSCGTRPEGIVVQVYGQKAHDDVTVRFGKELRWLHVCDLTVLS